MSVPEVPFYTHDNILSCCPQYNRIHRVPSLILPILKKATSLQCQVLFVFVKQVYNKKSVVWRHIMSLDNDPFWFLVSFNSQLSWIAAEQIYAASFSQDRCKLLLQFFTKYMPQHTFLNLHIETGDIAKKRFNVTAGCTTYWQAVGTE